MRRLRPRPRRVGPPGLESGKAFALPAPADLCARRTRKVSLPRPVAQKATCPSASTALRRKVAKRHLKKFHFTKADFAACKAEGSRSDVGKCMRSEERRV